MAGLVLLLLGVALAAGAQGKKMDLGGQRLGIIFNATSILRTSGRLATAFWAAWA